MAREARTDDEKLLRQTGIARLLGVTRQRVNQIVHEGKFIEPAYQDMALTLWDRAEVEKWAEENGYVVTY